MDKFVRKVLNGIEDSFELHYSITHPPKDAKYITFTDESALSLSFYLCMWMMISIFYSFGRL